MEAITTVIQTQGFPIACVVGLGFFIWKFVTRIQDENAQREAKLMMMLETYGSRLEAISSALEKLAGEIDGLKG